VSIAADLDEGLRAISVRKERPEGVESIALVYRAQVKHSRETAAT